MKQVTNTKLHWNEGQPISQSFDDIYFSLQDGLAETDYVFLRSNTLHERFSDAVTSFCIAETGFGTGLNFLACWQLWNEHAPEGASLTFISVERFPLTRCDLEKALRLWPDLAPLAKPMIAQYPICAKGFHTLSFNKGKVKLLLMFGDASTSYQQVSAKIDAWFLDGFAPSKNPDMWTPELFHEIARLSQPGTTFATFTAAGIVRRGLKDVGFDVRKQKGFGRKREMLVGTFVENKVPHPISKPWFEIPRQGKPEHAVVIGGGLAGCSTARALAERGIKVTLVEKNKELGRGGSGNRQGALYAKLPKKPTTQGELHLTGFLHTVRMMKQLDPKQTLWSQCGVVQLATNDNETQRQSEILNLYPADLILYKTADELSKISGSSIEHNGLLFPEAGWVSPRDFCGLLSNHDNITVMQADVSSIRREEQVWYIETSLESALSASTVVICNAEQANSFDQTDHLPLKTIRGQVSITPKRDTNPALNTVVCAEGYISPAKNGQFCFGATFDLKSKQLNVTEADHKQNLKNLAQALPQLHSELEKDTAQLSGRTAFRCSTPDYMPIVGAAPKYQHYIDTYAQLRKDKNWRFGHSPAEHHQGLYINTGHGSKGLITCPVSAELIASMICGEALPLPKDVINAISPSRFIIKNLIKQAI